MHLRTGHIIENSEREGGMTMGATLQTESSNIKVLRIRGVLKKKELDEAIACEGTRSPSGDHVRLLVIADTFMGFEKGEAFEDISSFFIKYGDHIDKIAIVGEPGWEHDLTLFAAAAPVLKFFCWPNIAAAREWLNKD
jgi:hypothetical protein